MNKSLLVTVTTLAALGAMASSSTATQRGSGDFLVKVDHLVYATPDLNAGIDAIERLLGVRATPGGQHPGQGTRNALVALGEATYLEIIGPDPEQPKPERPRNFGIDNLKASRLVAWVAKGTQLEQLAHDAEKSGVKLGEVISGRRQRPDGVVLSWRYTDPRNVIADRLIPYFIDWGASPHPARTAAAGASLISLRAQHPDAARVRLMLDRLGLDLPVQAGPQPALIATLSGPKGRVELR